MKDVNYREAKSALAPFNAANWFGGLFNHLEKVSKNMENAEEDIRDLDTDHAIHFQHTDHRSKYGEIEEDLKVLYQFSCHAGEKMETLVDQPFYEKLDAFVDGMEDLSITTYSTTNRIGAKSTQTYMSSYGGQPQVIESVKENATIEDLMNGDNFYANQMTLQYEAWKHENPDQKVSEADFKMGMLHTRAFDYKSIKDEQEEKEFWVNIVAALVIVGVSIVCPPAGLALGIGFGALEASSAISGKDWISGRELSDQERLLRGGFALLDIIPGVKAFSSGAKIASTGSKMLRVGDDLLGGGKLAIKNAGKEFQGTIDNGIQAGKKALDVRIPNVKKVTDSLAQEAKKKLTQDLDDIGTAAKTIQAKAKEAFQMPPRERLAFAGVGDDIAGQTATGIISAAQKELRDMMSNMDDLNIKGSGTGDIIKKASGAEKYSGDLMSPAEAKRYDDYWKKSGIGSNKTYDDFLKNNPNANLDDYFNLVREQSPWPNGYHPKEAVLKSGDQFEMALSVGQGPEYPGRFGTPTGTIRDVDYVRDNLAVKNDWKPSIDKVVTYRVKDGVKLPVLEGPVDHKLIWVWISTCQVVRIKHKF
ncbi:ribonuclease YeeF family protein [Listeria seeligeri]|uniref:pre-toxin TG domain-containing protein n=2 Tax=Listeria seeligeri TaxID=1640 RepID=UPI0016294B72|nr:pre-toxin TG domain-containing protein [Listeria seeligeri]MBC1833131.1 ribonuclease YeeF family protein [Listeria seeligeri]MBC1869261.1 ribonuclease YeeF family protein [Listeria seeligeri]MBC2094587.1 ribonuclease YeeF family protein [Listeria seeligeri]MBC6132418.1 ribonuclease YeeF family protein [Listeria seeligeri]MBC6144624.1 ribonuclease YeeF family protein [Listeria seeligeri]